MHLIHHIILRCLAWGFSSSGVERTFSRGAWCKAKRDVPEELAIDEVLATHFPESRRDEFPGNY